MSAIGSGVTLRGLYVDDAQLPFNLAAGITVAHIGLAVALDTSGPTQVKLAGDGDQIVGRLEVVEIRTQEGLNVGTVATEGGLDFAPKVGYVAAPGDRLVGGGAGLVRKALPADTYAGYSPWCVTEVMANGNAVAVEL
jgi:hypothetical protein